MLFARNLWSDGVEKYMFESQYAKGSNTENPT